ncbi:hypothetical protein GCM10010464_40860 [Pseudonocardia yunnanensis]
MVELEIYEHWPEPIQLVANEKERPCNHIRTMTRTRRSRRRRGTWTTRTYSRWRLQMCPGDALTRLARTAFADARATSMRESSPDHIRQLVRRESWPRAEQFGTTFIPSGNMFAYLEIHPCTLRPESCTLRS